MGAGDDVAELDVGKTAPKPDKAVKPRQHIVRRGTIIDLAFRGESLTPLEHACWQLDQLVFAAGRRGCGAAEQPACQACCVQLQQAGGRRHAPQCWVEHMPPRKPAKKPGAAGSHQGCCCPLPRTGILLSCCRSKNNSASVLVPACTGTGLLLHMHQFQLPVGMMLAPCTAAGASFKRDDARNDLVYGPGVSPYDIIRGDVPPPTEFLPLYDELHK